MSALALPSWTPIRRRRFLFGLTSLIALLFLFSTQWELPFSLRDAGYAALSRANIAHLTNSSPPKLDEVWGLLRMVTEEPQRVLSDVENLDPSQPISMAVYAGDNQVDWKRAVRKMNEKYPVIIFSKSYCPYSRRAKKLLDTYNIQPPPKVIEVDLRADSDIFKIVLGRLTQHHTFPNVIIRGKSIGGSDDLQALHDQKQLTKVLERAGAVVRNDGSGK
ncbi:hypothetical protein H0H81_000744 [Sphagnurus paluster]|uniref:Glutaredoxin domain-containing protein n=1 Tax=Sphagnurus paluster TaxID=117069 RepID=A0A9P7K805_9AGAR|nr:hypothetical protein H0H81_000744 [Sphagnurus paluster]